jgi:hypothetical protein
VPFVGIYIRASMPRVSERGMRKMKRAASLYPPLVRIDRADELCVSAKACE